MSSTIVRSKNPFQYISNWSPKDANAIIPPIQVVTCFIQKSDKILVLQRARKDAQYGLWGIPGGKLEDDELPLVGLVREIQEEIGLKLSSLDFLLLGSVLSHTPSDGQYGLYLYHTIVPEDSDVKINKCEHSDYKWVSLEKFESMKLLTAQGEAFYFVKKRLVNFFNLE